MTNQSANLIFKSIITNIVTWFIIIVISSFGTIIYIGIKYVFDMRELLLNDSLFPMWLSLIALPIPISIFAISYLIISRKKSREFICDYTDINPSGRISCKVSFNDLIYFYGYTNPPKSENDTLFARYIHIRGPYCMKCDTNLIACLNPITKERRYYYCSICGEKFFLHKKFKNNFKQKIRNLCSSNLRKQLKEKILLLEK